MAVISRIGLGSGGVGDGGQFYLDAVFGSDITGNGSLAHPYASFNKLNTVLYGLTSQPTNTSPFAVWVAPGVYNEGGNTGVFYPNCSYTGVGGSGSNSISANDTISYYALAHGHISAADSFTGLFGLTINQNFTFDFVALDSAGNALHMNDIVLTDANTFTYTNNGNDFVNEFTSFISEGYIVGQDMQVQNQPGVFGCNIATVSITGQNYGCLFFITSSTIGNLSLSYPQVVSCTAIGCSLRSVTIYGLYSFYYDADSYPTSGFNFYYAGSASPITQAIAINYPPELPGNWTYPPPPNVQAALDSLSQGLDVSIVNSYYYINGQFGSDDFGNGSFAHPMQTFYGLNNYILSTLAIQPSPLAPFVVYVSAYPYNEASQDIFYPNCYYIGTGNQGTYQNLFPGDATFYASAIPLLMTGANWNFGLANFEFLNVGLDLDLVTLGSYGGTVYLSNINMGNNNITFTNNGSDTCILFDGITSSGTVTLQDINLPQTTQNNGMQNCNIGNLDITGVTYGADVFINNCVLGAVTVDGVSTTATATAYFSPTTSLTLSNSSSTYSCDGISYPGTITLTSGAIYPTLLELNPWINITGTSAAILPGYSYMTSNAGLVTLSLPTTAAAGTQFEVTTGTTSGGWKISQGSGQQIRFGSSTSTSGTSGYLSSSNQGAAARLICTVANTDFQVVSSTPTLTIH